MHFNLKAFMKQCLYYFKFSIPSTINNFYVFVLRIMQITSSRESLIPYCHYYKDASETNTSYVCLRLQNLSLSRMGSFENLLWVQMLDLSHNELRSIEGRNSIIYKKIISYLFPPFKHLYNLVCYYYRVWSST